MRRAVLIFAHNRSRYLRVCLDSLIAAKCEIPVIVAFDGPQDDPTPLGYNYVAMEFPSHVDNLWHVVRSLDAVFAMSYDSILFLDCDMIVRKDIFQRLRWDVPPGITFICCDQFHLPDPVKASSPLGNVISKSAASPLIKYCYSMAWVGKERPWFPGTVMNKDYPGYDAVFLRYVLDHDTASLQSEIPLVGHIGVVGTNNRDTKLQEKMFSGLPDTWLSNAVKMFDPSVSPAFVPGGFRYE